MFEYDNMKKNVHKFHIVVTLKITPFLLLLLEGENEEKPKALFVNGQVMVMFKFNFSIFIIDVYPLEILKMSPV